MLNKIVYFLLLILLLLFIIKFFGFELFTNSNTNSNSNFNSSNNLDYYYLNSNNKMVCIYAYYEKNEQYKQNLQYFLDNDGILDHIDYYIVINGESTVDIPKLNNIKVINRSNKGFDFGAWQYVIKKYMKKKYDYYIFINSSVRGPFLQNRNNSNWVDTFLDLFKTGVDVKLVGTTINIFTPDLRYFFDSDPPYTHVQSMFFILNSEGFEYLLTFGFFDDEEALNTETNIMGIIFNKEIKMSQIILKHGWNINCILEKYRDHDYRTLKENINTSGTDPCHPGAYFGGTIIPEDVIFYKLYRFQK
jgi:hypothetical protein